MVGRRTDGSQLGHGNRPGPANEAGQTVSFSVVGNTKPDLFSVAPSVSPSGRLTYTPSCALSGTATITLKLSDNGGTANGGVNSSVLKPSPISVRFP